MPPDPLEATLMCAPPPIKKILYATLVCVYVCVRLTLMLGVDQQPWVGPHTPCQIT